MGREKFKSVLKEIGTFTFSMQVCWPVSQFLKVLSATMSSSPSKSVQSLTRKELEEEVTEYRMLMKEMKSMVECP